MCTDCMFLSLRNIQAFKLFCKLFTNEITLNYFFLVLYGCNHMLFPPVMKTRKIKSEKTGEN